VTLAVAYRGVAPVIIGSALTVSVALACLGLTKVRVFRSGGIPYEIGILATVLAALTLTPELIGLAVQRGFLEPRPSSMARRWRPGLHRGRGDPALLMAAGGADPGGRAVARGLGPKRIRRSRRARGLSGVPCAGVSTGES
jgi:RND superfamily putative drug exporter